MGAGNSSVCESGAKAIDTKREAKDVQGKQCLELGIALAKDNADPFEGIIKSIQVLPTEQQARVALAGSSAFAGALSDQVAQVMHGVHDGTANFVDGGINAIGKFGNAAMGLARFETDLQNEPVRAGGEILDAGLKASRIAQRLGTAAHQGLESATHYYRDAVTGKVQPLDDAQRLAINGTNAALRACERWDAQSTYDKTTQAVEATWTFALPSMVEGIAALKAAGTPEAEAGLNAIQQQLGKIEMIFDRYDELRMPEVPEHLKHVPLQSASPQLLEAIREKGVPITFATSDEDIQHLKSVTASAVYRYFADGTHEIVLPPDPAKIQVFEEYLHSVQRKLGLLDNPEIPREIAEIHVKDFMIRHANMLGLNEYDTRVLQWLKDREIEKASKSGLIWKD